MKNNNYFYFCIISAFFIRRELKKIEILITTLDKVYSRKAACFILFYLKDLSYPLALIGKA